MNSIRMWKIDDRTICFLLIIFQVGLSLNPRYQYNSTPKSKVIVTGADGRTGRRVFSKLMRHPSFDPIGLVRTESSAKKLLKDFKCGLDHVVVSDVTTISRSTFPQGLEGATSMIICTSAIPSVSQLSVLKAILKIPYRLIRKQKAINPRDFRFKFKPGQYPEKVDYEGQKSQVDMAALLGVEQVVVVSSMGGTDPNNFLNSIGKNKDGSGHGDILLWKRKAEQYLVESGLHYTIIHPGGLTDRAESVDELVLDVDDKLLRSKNRSISRGDVANLCVAALTVTRYRYVSFDCIGMEAADGATVKTAEEALNSFLDTGKTADYTL